MTDAINFGDVEILNSPDIRDWPITSEIQELGLRRASLHLVHTKQGRWPAVRFGDALQESTLWIFLRIGGRWLGAGVERIRPGQIDKPENAPSHQDDDWFYDQARWREMTTHEPQPGELVGYMVAAGDTRGFGNVAVQERSAIVLVEFPPDTGRDYPPFATLPPAPSLPAPVPMPAPGPSPIPIDDLFTTATKLIESAVALAESNLRLADKIAELQKTGVRIHW
jgi:hypothetical protein